MHRRDVSFNVDEGSVIIADGVHIASFSIIQGHGGVHIGRDCTIGAGSKIYTLSNHYRSFDSTYEDVLWKYSSMAEPNEQSLISGPVEIADYCAVTPNCILLSGARLGQGSWLLSNSILTDDIGEMKIVAGNPAKCVKDRETN